MKALSIRQPWAWLILHAGKDIENRGWYTPVRGRILIHAAKGMTRAEYADCRYSINEAVLTLPAFEDLPRGGIVGSVEIVDCVDDSDSEWFSGSWGFVLRDPQLLPFREYRGQLGFFEVAA